MCLLLFVFVNCFTVNYGSMDFFKNNFGLFGSESDSRFGTFSESERLRLVEETKQMFYHGYDNYMKHAFPADELNPIYCKGRGPDVENPSNININDVLGDYALTLVDTLDTIAIMGNNSEFKKAVQLVIDNVSFDKPNVVQVFEATIRVLGGLLSAHLLITDPRKPFGDLTPTDYDGELLSMSHDLAARLMPAFEDTATGLPHPRVNLRYGVPLNPINETCTSGAGSLLLEFGMLSRLLNDPVYEAAARRTVKTLWHYRSNVTGLLGNVINIQTGEWVGQMSGLGAGLDSYFEYLLKSFVLFGEESDLKMFNESYEVIKFHMRRGRLHCNNGSGNPPIYVNVNMKTGDLMNNWIDALQAAWSGVQVLFGDLEEAICSHALYYTIWRKYGVLPERFNWNMKLPDILFYPLRPELVESTYLLYQATKNPFYLHVGKDILNNLNTYAKAECGYATIHDVNKKDQEDRMESFFLSETCKYLYLLFDTDNHVNKEASRYLFTTEGHLFRVDKVFRQKDFLKDYKGKFNKQSRPPQRSILNINPVVDTRKNITNCDSIPAERHYFLPMKRYYLQQMEAAVGLV